MVAFDFDGVIANSWEVVMGIVRLADPEISEAEYRERFRGNVEGTVAALTDRLGHDFFDEYAAKADEMPMFEGMREVIENLCRQYVLTIVSSTRTDILDAFLRVHNLRDCFAGLYGNTEGYSKAVKLRKALEELAVDAQKSVFVTDTLGDLKEAATVQVATIAVTWGYHGAETLANGGPVVVVTRPADLVDEVQRVLA